jgi:hypothetical protein
MHRREERLVIAITLGVRGRLVRAIGLGRGFGLRWQWPRRLLAWPRRAMADAAQANSSLWKLEITISAARAEVWSRRASVTCG